MEKATITFQLTKEEQEIIKGKAFDAHLSLSAYLRNVALGKKADRYNKEVGK